MLPAIAGFMLLAGIGPAGAAQPILVEVAAGEPATLPTGAVVEVKILEGGVADRPDTPVYGISRLPAGGRPLPVTVTVPVLDPAGLGRSMRPILNVRIESAAGRLLFINTKRAPVQPGSPQRVKVDPIP
jgi:uncharacterized lipoprotein YbaY